MMKDVVIQIVSKMIADETTDVEFTTVGKMARGKDKWLLYYDENHDSGDKIKTVVKIADDNTVKIIRSGDNESRLIVEKGKRYTSHYETAVGSMTIAISGNDVEVHMDEHGGKVHLDYMVDINAGFASHNIIDISIREDHISV